MSPISNGFTALVKQDGAWWVGWIAEISGVNCQEPTREHLLVSLRTTLGEALVLNRSDAIAAAGEGFVVVEITS